MNIFARFHNLLILLVAVLIFYNVLLLIRGGRGKHEEPAEDDHYEQGIAYLMKGYDEEAKSQFERSVKVNPRDAEAHYQLGKIYRDKGQKKKAFKEFEQYLKFDGEKKWKEEVEEYLEG